MAGRQKSLVGTVVSNKMEKTVVVVVESTTRHRLYRKILRRTKRYLAHDDRFDSQPGDQVMLLETRPLSRHKRWRVGEVIKRGDVPDVAPREIDAEYIGVHRQKEAEDEAAEVTPPQQATSEETGTDSEAVGPATPTTDEVDTLSESDAKERNGSDPA
jgi:small subunit ribosomal protein S17